MRDDDRYLEAARVECADLTREQLIRRVGALMRRLDSETARANRWRRDYQLEPAGEQGNA